MSSLPVGSFVDDTYDVVFSVTGGSGRNQMEVLTLSDAYGRSLGTTINSTLKVWNGSAWVYWNGGAWVT